MERPNHPDSSCPLALTDDLLAMLDQHFLDDGPELLDGSDGLQKKKKKIESPRQANTKRTGQT